MNYLVGVSSQNNLGVEGVGERAIVLELAKGEGKG